MIKHLVIEGKFEKSEYTWWRCVLNRDWDIHCACGNTQLFSVCTNLLDTGCVVWCVIDVVADNAYTIKLSRELFELQQVYYQTFHVSKYPGFEVSILKCVPDRLCINHDVVLKFLHNIGHWETIPELVTYAQKSLTGYAGKSSEWFGTQLMLKLVEECASVSKSILGMCWKVDCPNTNCTCRFGVTQSLSTKYQNYLRVNNFTFTAETSDLVTQSMIDNYGSYELALQHLKEIGVI